MYSMSCADLIKMYQDPYALKISTCFSKIVEMKPRDICSNLSYLLRRTVEQKEEESLSNNVKKKRQAKLNCVNYSHLA